jgi:hypothetical protein
LDTTPAAGEERVMSELSISELQSIRDNVARLGKLSDGLFRLGPFRLGLDGALAWVPGLGELYSAGAATYILVQGYRAGVPAATLATCAALLFGRTIVTAVPIAGPLAADMMTAHRWSSKLVVRAIDAKLAAAGAPVKPRGRRWAWSGRMAPAAVRPA